MFNVIMKILFSETAMDFSNLNPVIHSVSLCEKIRRTDECVSYDSKIIYTVSGNISVTVSGKKLDTLAPGSLLYVPAGVPYSLKARYFKAVIIGFDFTTAHPTADGAIVPVPVAECDGSLCRVSDILEPFSGHIFIADMESERERFLEMESIFTSAQGSFLARISAMLKLLILKIAESIDENALPARMVDALDGYIRENCSEEISNTEIGAIFGYHPFYVSKLLKERKGQTLRQYIMAYRLKLARRMLEFTDKSTAEIAEEAGFTDASYFAKTFKNAFGTTPKDYRNKFKDSFL